MIKNLSCSPLLSNHIANLGNSNWHKRFYQRLFRLMVTKLYHLHTLWYGIQISQQKLNFSLNNIAIYVSLWTAVHVVTKRTRKKWKSTVIVRMFRVYIYITHQDLNKNHYFGRKSVESVKVEILKIWFVGAGGEKYNPAIKYASKSDAPFKSNSENKVLGDCSKWKFYFDCKKRYFRVLKNYRRC